MDKENMVHTYTVQWYSVIKNTGKWMEIKYILLNKVSWKKDKTSHVFSQMDNDLKAELGLLKK